jgi:hypothetical protein
MRNLLFVLLLVAVLFVAVSVSPVQAGEAKVSVCHVPPGLKGHVVLVSPTALSGHLAHGDWILDDPNSITLIEHCEQGQT